ncbi:ATP-dependent helicase [Patescibacteria group bacterium]
MLNPEQQKAAETIEGPLLITAGAGTGKTFTLINRVGQIIKSKKITTNQVLILTFTNKAAHELTERLVKNKYFGIQVMTFHSLAAKLLRKFWKIDFTINDDEDPETLNFDQLLTKILETWTDNPKSLKKSQKLFKYIMVDEYQDVNTEQIKIITKLVENHKNICVVGDEDQTIYSWRGAHASTMNNFVKIFPKTQNIVLQQNYRNPPNILKASEELIINNKDRTPKILQSTKIQNQKTKLWKSNNPWEQSEIISHLLEKYLGSHSNMVDADYLDNENQETNYSFSDIAFIYRTQEQGKKIAVKLEKRGYPCQRSAADNFWKKAEINQFINELKPLINLPKFPKKSFSEWIQDRIDEFINNQEIPNHKQTNLNLLLSIAINFNHQKIKTALQNFLDEAETSQEADNLIKPNAIQLLTFHAAKGLEFPIVIILDLNEEIIPHKQSLGDGYLISEERRLLYVGMTRATENLHLITNTKKPKSRFLEEIKTYDLGALPSERTQKLKKRELKRRQPSLF